MRRLLGIVAAAALLAVLGPIALAQAHHGEPGNACTTSANDGEHGENVHCDGEPTGQSSDADLDSPGAEDKDEPPPCEKTEDKDETTAGADCDGDLWPNGLDNCDADANQGQDNSDDDDFGDACDQYHHKTDDGGNADADGDGKINKHDNCPVNWNLEQTNTDGAPDGGDVCDSNDDDDDLPDTVDPAPKDASSP
jgi:thrombospondin 2/3/4/5